ncbi:DUF6907 domain-containing protein [Streptomyces sp. NPDC008079]|uniref:DUF6907 domain-containing protein n=1 Tax=Streptomyces sp. NPDC008079 TaxID=3364806 RepID=UPI0036ED4DE6
MTAPRTVTVPTSDHGDVTIPEPAWCIGIGHDVPNLRAEIAHQGEPFDITVNTARGPRRLLELMLWQDPFPSPASPHGATVYQVARLLDGDHFGYDFAGLEGLVTDLLEAAGTVRRIAACLRIEYALGGGR